MMAETDVISTRDYVLIIAAVAAIVVLALIANAIWG